MGTQDLTAEALVSALADGSSITHEQRGVLIGVVMQQAKRDVDADRYRWLRDSRRIPRDADPDGHIVVCSGGGEDVLWGAALDAAVDQCMHTAETPNVEGEARLPAHRTTK